MNRFSRVALILCSSALAAIEPAAAQALASAPPALEIALGAGGGQLWDDETRLGPGVLIAGGVGWRVGGHVLLSAGIDWFTHHRHSGALAANGKALSGFAGATYVFGATSSRVRPLIGAGLGAIHSSGTLVTSGLTTGPNGQPVAAPDRRTPWVTTRAAFDLHGGVRLGVHPRVALRPEVRWRSTTAPDVNPSPGGIELPLLNIQGLVSLDLRLR